MLEERRPLPESIGGLIDTAARAYRRRFRLYFGTAMAGLVAEAIASYLLPNDAGLLQAGSIVVDSAICALVTIGIVADMRSDDRPTDGAVASRALARWGIVAVVTTLVNIVTLFTSDAVLGPPEDTAYGFLILPIVVAWGSLGFASVIAATDDKTSSFLLAFSSLGRSALLALARPNLGRLVVLAVVAVLPMFVEKVLVDQLELRKIAGSQFVGSIPIDALVTGPLQALFTVFYLDFMRRMNGGRRV